MMKLTLVFVVLALALVEIECGGVYYAKHHCKKPGHYPDPNNCHAFIQCDEWGKAFHHYCPKGTVFNPYIDVCDHKYNYKCGSYIPGHKKHGYGYLKGNPCLYKHGALLPYPKNCHYFIHCSNGIGYIKACPAYLVWDPYWKTCDWYHPKRDYHCHYDKKHGAAYYG